MNDLSSDQEQRKRRIELMVKLAAMVVVGFFVAPFVFIAIKGLIGLMVAAVISLAAVNFAPFVAVKIANWRLKALKYEASKNPIETLQNNFKDRIAALTNYRTAIRDFAAEVQTFHDKLDGFKTEWPTESGKFDTQYSQMVSLLEIRKQKYEQAKVGLKRYEAEISKAKAIWDMSQAAAKLANAAGVNTDEFYAKIMVETALDSVQKSVSTSFADLEISLLDEKKAPASINTAKPAAPIADSSSPQSLELEINIPERKPAR